ncbi:MAG TPA: hypothetical protein VHL59_07030, partial [Thermoanaerobaculia bacterium]|nr:hypothetical protein [Thermoanaerobaculia bacterium]
DGYGALLLQHDAGERPRDLTLMGDNFVSILIPVEGENDLRRTLCEVAELAGVPAPAARKFMPAPRALIAPAA